MRRIEILSITNAVGNEVSISINSSASFLGAEGGTYIPRYQFGSNEINFFSDTSNSSGGNFPIAGTE